MPRKDGDDILLPYDFGWPVTGDLTLCARWQPVLHTVSFVSIAGEDVAFTQEVEHGRAVTNPGAPQRFEEGKTFVFLCWSVLDGGVVSDDVYDFSTPVTADLTLYAGYDVKSCTVTFDSKGGREVAPQVVTFGQKATEPAAPTYAGHKFLGWYELIEGGVEKSDFDAYPEVQKLLEFWAATRGSSMTSQTRRCSSTRRSTHVGARRSCT